MEESELLNFVRAQLARISSCADSNNDGVTTDIVQETLDKMEGFTSVWKKDALRYRFVANGAIMSDGRPFIAQTQYSYGKTIGQNILMENECNAIIDSKIDFNKD